MSLAFTRTGSGEPVLLLHGITHRRQAWDRVLPLCRAERDLIALDLPDHGESPDLPPGYGGDVGTLADAVEDFAAELGVVRPHVVGNSLGGLIALELAARGTVRSATALSPAGFWSAPERLWARGVLGGAHAALATVSEARVERLLGSPVTRRALVGLVMAHPSRVEPAELASQLVGLRSPRASFRAMLRALGSWRLPARTAVPTTIGWGSRDFLLPRWQIARLRRALPDAAIYLLPGCGHVPMGDDPQLVADLVLAGTRPRG